jgi:hypothetical protein
LVGADMDVGDSLNFQNFGATKSGDD